MPALRPGAQFVKYRNTLFLRLTCTVHHGREEVLATLGAVSDFSFSWGLMDRYTSALQAQARNLSLSQT